MATIGGLDVKIGADDSDLVRALRGVENKLDNFGKDVNSKSDRMGDAFENLGKKMVAAFAIEKVIEVGKEIVEVTRQVQKMQAVLSNTLGGKGAGAAAFAEVENFAAKTNFQVNELVDSFTKLNSRGARPTMDAFAAMGDVANFLGKDMSQLTEAILDVNNTERWTELGIKAKTAGDKVSLTFNGVTKEVERSEKGVLSAITAFGQMDGVLGTTAKIAETLDGKLSNLDDAWNRLYATVGNQGGGVFGKAVDQLTTYLGLWAEALSSTEQLGQRDSAGQTNQDLADISANLKKVAEDAKAANQDVAAAVDGFANQTKESYASMLAFAEKDLKEFEAQHSGFWERIGRFNPTGAQAQEYRIELAKLSGEVERYKALVEAIPSLARKITAGMEAVPPTLGLIEALQKELKSVNELHDKAGSEREITAYQQRANAIQDEIDRLNELGTARNSLELVNQQIAHIDEKMANPDISDSLFAKLAKQADDLNAKLDRIVDKMSSRALSTISLYEDKKLRPLKRVSTDFELDKKGNVVDTSVPELINIDKAEQVAAGVKKAVKSIVTDVSDMGIAMVDMTSMVGGAFEQLGVTLGAALTGSINTTEGFFKSILGIVGSFMSQFGKALISAGVAALAFKKLLANPIAAIAAGVALVAASAVVTDIASRGPSGGGGGGSGISSGRNYATTGNIRPGDYQKNIEVTGRLYGSGRELVAVIETEGKKQKRVGG